jgi:hypothetical protein
MSLSPTRHKTEILSLLKLMSSAKYVATAFGNAETIKNIKIEQRFVETDGDFRGSSSCALVRDWTNAGDATAAPPWRQTCSQDRVSGL